jgi:formylglycine-generating enzyme required for sulfatase activity/transcriptional regulator with XRE-family HTH domain
MTDLDLGTVLRQLRLDARLSQHDLAVRIGFHEAAVSGIERGERAPSAPYLTGFVAALRLEVTAAERIWQLYRRPPPAGPAGLDQHGEAAGPCPYRGLLAFREEDTSLFHGRETAVRRIVRKLESGPLAAVVGASGSGKSSAVFAGVIPRMRRASAWDVVAMRPGRDPFEALARACGSRLAGGTVAAGVSAVVEDLARHRDRPILVVIDQFEELFTHQAGAAIVGDFLDGLVTLLRTPGTVPVKVLLTFRGDFYGRVIAHREFSDVLQDSVVHLPPMSRTELRQAVTEPARTAGLTLDDALADRILDDAGTRPGNLPLLEFALSRLWEQRRGRSLTHEAYEQIGRLPGAITARAEDVYRALSPEEQYAARQLLVRLVQVARPEEDGNDARRRTPLAELRALPRVGAVIAVLADARLVVTDGESVGDPTVELAHEAIIQSWDRLRGWLVEDRQFLLWQQRTRQWLQEWRHATDRDGALLRGSVLDEASRWLAVKGHESIAQDLLDYLEASQREAAAERRRLADAYVGHLLTVRPRDVVPLAATDATHSPELQAAIHQRLAQGRAAERWRLRVALLSTDATQAEQLVDEMDRLSPDELIAVKDATHPLNATIEETLWDLIAGKPTGTPTLMYGALLLAGTRPDDPRWPGVAPVVAAQLVEQNQLHLRTFVDALRPVREYLFGSLLQIFADTTDRRAATRETTATILLDLAADQPRILARMAVDALPQNYDEIYAALERVLTAEAIATLQTIVSTTPEKGTRIESGAGEALRVVIGRRRAAALSTLLRLGEVPDLDSILTAAPDPELSTQFSFQARNRKVPVTDLLDRLAAVSQPRAQYTLLLGLGEYPVEPHALPVVEAMQVNDDPGVRAAAAWLIRRWDITADTATPGDDGSAAYDPTGRRGWFTAHTGTGRLTFAVFRPGRFTMGSPADEAERSDYESPQQDTTITRSYALCTREVTRTEFETFMHTTSTYGLPNIDEWSPLGSEPVVAATWTEAVAFVEWLSTAGDTQHLSRRLRLPTEAEWEYACRAGTTTAYSFGSDRTLLDQYGWYADNSGLKTHEAGILRPNPGGLFNIHGQCWEWCLDWYAPYSGAPVTDPTGPQSTPAAPRSGRDPLDRKVLRGGCWNLGARYARSACRNAHIPSNRNYYITFRLAVTVPDIDPGWTPGDPQPLPWTG